MDKEIPCRNCKKSMKEHSYDEFFGFFYCRDMALQPPIFYPFEAMDNLEYLEYLSDKKRLSL